jgi:ABC-type polysaccharide/polyol phosphate transport system ATPase subunit
MKNAIEITNLSKIYNLGEIGTGTLSRDIERWYKVRIRRQEDPLLKIGETNIRDKKGTKNIVYSLRDINLKIKQGIALGIIGKNGAGKSTLLKIISRITSPSTGRIKIKGRVASLLEVGTGFHPELTGRENIFLNGAILGMRKSEIYSKLDQIIDFSGVERYIDTPIKRYSSGMYVRLAFAVAAHLESEILIVDEVLAVGDAEFQRKCLGKMGEISTEEGRTILFVSHNMAAIQNLCSTGILIEDGMICKEGSVNEVVQYYFSLGLTDKIRPPVDDYRSSILRDIPAFINDIYVKNSKDNIPTIQMGTNPIIVINITVKQKIINANLSVTFLNSEGIKTDLAFSMDDNYLLNLEVGKYEIEFRQNCCSLPPNKYYIAVGINQSYNTLAWDVISNYPIFEVENRNNILHWVNRPWAIHHSKENLWESYKID